MKTVYLAIVSDGQMIDTQPLSAVDLLRLRAFAKTNKIGLAKMVALSIKFATAVDGESPDLRAPDEDKIVEYAALSRDWLNDLRGIPLSIAPRQKVRLALST